MKYAICLLAIITAPSAFARNACSDSFIQSEIFQSVLKNQQFQEALRMYEEAGYQIASIRQQQEQSIADIKKQNAISDFEASLLSDAKLRIQLSNDLLSQIKDTILASHEKLKPWRRNLKMSEGLLMYYQGKLEVAGFQVFFMKTRESHISEEDPEMTEARLFGDTENLNAKYQHLVASSQGRLYVVSPTISINDTTITNITSTNEVVAITYANSLIEFSGSAPVSSQNTFPMVMQVELSNGPEGYLSSQLIARDFKEVCK
jgi:hypothetical protein